MRSSLAAALLSLLLAACAAEPRLVARGPLPQPSGWKAVLIAGDSEEPAFDNAVDAMAARLESFGVPAADIVVLKATAQGQEAATRDNIVAAFDGLHPARGDGCFVFITSHGGRDEGLVMRRADAFLSPGDLDDLLSRSCEDRATVVIASGCYSGSFAEGRSMPASTRVILTAARDDRTSFGCNAGRKLTVFDQCILESLRRGLSWKTVMERTRACVSSNEEQLGMSPPSSPQIWVGADVDGLRAF